MASWRDVEEALGRLAKRQLFFIGGPPRSGTTWLQFLLDSHPDISCGGEGLFMKHLAEPLDALMAARRQVIATKNDTLFRSSDGYPLPEEEDADHLAATGILLALERNRAGRDCRAVGEKTPENVFFFPRLKRVFPDAKLIAIARDPRDIVCSAWHFFHAAKPGEEERAAKLAFIRLALPPLQQGARATLALAEKYPADCLTVTYEHLNADPATMAASLFRFLGVSDAEDTVASCLTKTSFAALSGGRPAGVGVDGSFYRKGVVGDWPSTLTPEMNELILAELGWMFPRFGWTA